mgnify:CR=1 FL=1
MTWSQTKLGRTSNARIASRCVGCAVVALLAGTLAIASQVKAESVFPVDVWATKLIQPEPLSYMAEKEEYLATKRFLDRLSLGRGPVPLPVRNPMAPTRSAPMPTIEVNAATETAITTGSVEKDTKMGPVELPKSKLAKNYCVGLKDVVENARLEWQRRDLEKVKALVDEQTTELKKKISELEKWYNRRQAIAKDFEKRLKQIYKNMQPDNAANQMGSMKASVAKQILLQLTPAEAGAILDEMEPEKAAALASLIAAEARHLAKQAEAVKKIAGKTP